MDELLAWLILLTPIAVWAGFKIRSRQQEASRRTERERDRDEDRRVRDCHEVVRFFANELGYIAREVVSRDELEALITAGIEPDALAEEIWSRCDAAGGLVLGAHPIGENLVPVKLPDRFRERHLYVVGKSGSGKTTLLRNLVLQDLEAGAGLAVLAPEAELLTEELLPYVPEDRWDDVIVLNPADTERPVPLNPLHVDASEDLDRKVDETFIVLRRIFGDEEGGSRPRMEALLRQTLYTLMQIPGSTLLDVERLLDRSDPSFRKRVVGQLADDELRTFWSSSYLSFPKDAHLPLTNRIGRFLRPEVVRSVLCQPGESLNVRAAMDEGKVLLVNLSDGLLGESNAAILGQLVVAKLQLAAMSRADLPKAERRPFYVYLDEFQTFCGVVGTSYERMLSRARKYGLGLILAHQQTGQIPLPLLKDILGNVSTSVMFQLGAGDARRLGAEMIGEVDGRPLTLDPDELVTLRIGEAWCRIGRSVLFMRTDPPPEWGRGDVAAELMARSRSRYGVGAREASPAAKPTETVLDGLDPGKVF